MLYHKIRYLEEFSNCLMSLTKIMNYPRLKGIVHPKMKILSSFTHPQVVPNLYECLVLLNTRKMFWIMWGSGAPLTSIVFLSYYGSQWCLKTAWWQTFFKISSLVFSRTKKFIQVWNYLRVSKWWQNFHFGWTIPLEVKDKVIYP